MVPNPVYPGRVVRAYGAARRVARAISRFALVGAAVWCGSPAAAQDRLSERQGNPQRPSDGEGGANVPPDCARFLGSVSCPMADKAVSLIASGPAINPPPRNGALSVTEFVRQGWPFVIDFEPQPGTRTEFRIKLWVRVGPIAFPLPVPAMTRVLDPTGEGGRQYQRFAVTLPTLEGESDLRIADYEVASERCDGRDCVAAPVHVYALGAGPRAVGSVTLDNVAFSQASVVKPSGNEKVPAGYSYELERDFNAAQMSLFRACGERWCFDRGSVGQVPSKAGVWSGKWEIDRKSKTGSYQLWVRAWLNCPGLTPADQYKACADDAAWATGHADGMRIDP